VARRPVGSVYVVTGERGSGKSTVCAQTVLLAQAAGLAVTGILTEREGPQEGALRRVIDIRSGERRRFGSRPASVRDSSNDPAASDPLTPGWEFESEVFAWANEVLSRAVPSDLMIVDELGPLELVGGRGWANALAVLRCGDFRAAVVVCRPGLLDVLYEHLGRLPDARFDVTMQTREALPAAIMGLVSRMGASS